MAEISNQVGLFLWVVLVPEWAKKPQFNALRFQNVYTRKAIILKLFHDHGQEKWSKCWMKTWLRGIAYFKLENSAKLNTDEIMIAKKEKLRLLYTKPSHQWVKPWRAGARWITEQERREHTSVLPTHWRHPCHIMWPCISWESAWKCSLLC